MYNHLPYPTVNRVCQKEVACEWIDPLNGLQYDFSAKVIVSHDYEVESVDFLSIDVYDGDQEIDTDVAWIMANSTTVKQNLEKIAGSKAIEKAQEEDFAVEVERE